MLGRSLATVFAAGRSVKKLARIAKGAGPKENLPQILSLPAEGAKGKTFPAAGRPAGSSLTVPWPV